MSLLGKFAHVQELKSPAISFLEYLGSKKHNLPKICPSMISSLEVVEGNWGVKDAILLGRYLLDGNEVISKEVLEDLDEMNKSITYTIFDGDMMKFYKFVRVTFQVTSDDEKNYLKTTYEYEKLSPEIPAPEQFKDFAAEIMKRVDEYHLKSELTENKSVDEYHLKSELTENNVHDQT